MFLPTLRQMQYLIALRDHKSFSKAADACAVTQPTLSAGIKDLENILGQPVIDRTSRKVILTSVGESTAQNAEEIIEQSKHMTEQARHLSQPMTGPMRLGVIPTIAPYLLPNILPRIQKDYPDLELQIYEDMSERLVEKLRSGDLDLALLAFPYDTPDLHQEELFKEEFYLAAPKSKETKTITPDDLDPGELLLLEDGHCLSDHALSACNLQLPGRRKAYSASSLATLLQMVSNGYGITLIPEMAANSNIIPNSVQITKFKRPTPTRSIGLTWRPGSSRAKDFKTLGTLIIQKS